ncbi:MAG: MlaD family protein [Aquabacterium sp.]
MPTATPAPPAPNAGDTDLLPMVEPPAQVTKRRFSVGFVLLGLVLALLLGGGIAWQQGLLRPLARLYFLADDVTGLAPGNTVRLSGFRIGKVESMVLQPDLKVRVTLAIDQEPFSRLRADARADLVREQLKPAAIVLRPGAAAQPLNPDDPQVSYRHRGTLTDIAEDLRTKLVPILEDIRALTGTARQRRDELDSVMTNAGVMAREMAGAAQQMHAMTQTLNRRTAGLGGQAETALHETQRTIQQVGALVAQAERSLGSVNARLPELLGQTDRLLGQVSGVVSQLDGVLKDTRVISSAAARDLPPLLKGAPQLVDESRDLLKGLGGSWPLRLLLPPPPELLLPMESQDALLPLR